MEIIPRKKAEILRKERLEMANSQVRNYSKLRICTKLKEAEVWEAVKSSIESAGIMDEWLLAVDLASDHPLFQAVLGNLQAQFPELDTEAILQECEIL